MARNIEIKAGIGNFEALQPKVAALADHGPVEIAQDDVFFRCEAGRLKLRTFAETVGELIFYQRPDLPGPKESFYVRSPAHEPAALREVLSRAYGEIGRVRKKRLLYRVGRTRVHLDSVESLGDFVELEVVLAERESPQAGIDVARQLMSQLGIEPAQFIEGSYLDLIAGR